MKKLLLLFLSVLLSNQLTVLANTHYYSEPFPALLYSDYTGNQSINNQCYFDTDHNLDVSKSNTFTTSLRLDYIFLIALALGVLLFIFKEITVPSSILDKITPVKSNRNLIVYTCFFIALIPIVGYLIKMLELAKRTQNTGHLRNRNRLMGRLTLTN